MKRLIPLLFVLAGAAQAACPATIPSNRACIAWTPPTTNTDDSPVAGPLKFRVYRRVGSTTTWTLLLEVTAGTDVLLANQPAGVQCYAMTAVDVLARESAMSNTACKTVRFPGPTDGSIEAPSDGSIEFP